MLKPLSVIDAPSNLGLRPPGPGLEPGGLGYPELVGALRVLLRSGLAVGMDVTIFDPDGDPTGEISEGLTLALVEAAEEGA